MLDKIKEGERDREMVNMTVERKLRNKRSREKDR